MGKSLRNRRLQDSITVILHRPAIPENIGATVRAMANMGYSRLILSDPRTDDMKTAARLAVSASWILDRALSCPSLEEALTVSGARFLVGATARDRRYWDPVEITVAAPFIHQRAASGGAAILFGPEDKGLSNEELTLCHMLVTIPAYGELGSYNLSHAAAITLFTLTTTSPSKSPAVQRQSAAFEEMERMYSHLQELLTEVDFLWEDNPDHMMRAVREFINRAQPSGSEAKMIRGICRRLLWHLRNRGA